ncbi:MAG: hypothetical protein H0X51_06380 [Parachlamydiaceae bacterium]|nr:hypothetical protein [Parachlamydiaceae bacterium]
MSTPLSTACVGDRVLRELSLDTNAKTPVKRTDTRVMDSVTSRWQEETKRHKAESDWLMGDSVPIPKRPSSVEGEWKEDAAAEKLKTRFYHKKAKNALDTPLKPNDYEALLTALRARSALTHSTAISHSVAVAQMKSMTESSNFTAQIRTALAMPYEAEKKGEAEGDAIRKLGNRCSALVDLSPYLLEKLKRQKLLPSSCIQQAIQKSLQLDEESNNATVGFRRLIIEGRLVYCGFKDSEPTFLFPVRKIGEGGSGLVCEVVEVAPSAEPDQIKALKTSKIDPIDGYDSYQELVNEVEYFERVAGIPGLLQMEYSLETARSDSEIAALKKSHRNPIYPMIKSIVFPKGKSLHSILAEGNLTQLERLQLAEKLAQTVIAVSDHGWVHRDIKPQNILYLNGELVFCDLMDMATLSETDNFNIYTGTPSYICPKMGKHLKKMIKDENSEKRSDYLLKEMSFSCAMVMYDILTPYPSRPLNKKHHPELIFDLNTDHLKHYPRIISKMMQALLHQDPDKRLYSWEMVLDVLQKIIIRNKPATDSAASPRSHGGRTARILKTTAADTSNKENKRN